MLDLRHLPRPATTRLRVSAKSQRFARLQRQRNMSTKAARLDDMAYKYQDIFLDQVKTAAMILLMSVMENTYKKVRGYIDRENGATRVHASRCTGAPRFCSMQ